MQDGPERREALMNFWEETYAEIYADPMGLARRHPLGIRPGVLQAYIELEDEERGETGREFQVIRRHMAFEG
jgi:hypothetical protein